jgi:hypothetical protein
MCFTKQFLRKMWPILLASLPFIAYRTLPSFLTLSNASSFLTRSVRLISSSLLQHHISKLSKYSWSTFRGVQRLASHKAALQI